uniref:Sodium/hydrogen exchanger 10 n=9 Tax=Lygus hesperus TaxID=30085 RepID=A0A0A9XFR5_LYGHE
MGSLTVREYDYLSTIVEGEVNNPEPKLHPEKMKFRSNFTKVLIQLKRVLLWFSKLTAEVYHFIPQSTIRNWCYQISTSRQLRIMMALLTLTDTALTMAQVIIYYTTSFATEAEPGWGYSETNWTFGSTVQKLHIFFYTLSLLEFLILMLGLGLDQYFSRNVNKIEASTGIILGTLEIVIYMENCLRAGRSMHPYEIPIIMLIKSTTPLRLAKIYILIIAAVPKIIASIDATLGDEMMRNYELGKAYLVALNRTSALLNRIVYSEAVYTELMKEIDSDRMLVTKEMGLIQKDDPSIATTVKTRHAIRYVINGMEDCIKDMKEEGVIDMIEAEAVQDSLGRNKNILRELLMISATPPEEILKNIPWLRDDQENLTYLLQNAELTSYDYGDVLIHAGDDPVGIHLLVSGLLRSHYIPSTTTLQLNSKFGVLPNYDFFNNVKFDQPQESYVVSGSIIGEIGAVSGRRYDMTINCDTAVQVYYIPWEIVKQVVHESEDSKIIMSKIWKAISIKIALNILLYNVVTFQGWAPEKLLLFLNKGFVPIIPEMISVVITTRVEIIILIEGLVMDKFSRTVYTAPVYIPKSMHEIILPEHPDWEYSTMIETRMLIIPSNISNEEELKGPGGIFKFREKERSRDDDSPHRKVGFDVDPKEIVTKSENLNSTTSSKIL